MSISWFPGHMHKARKELAKLVKKASLIIEVLDARVPNASRNPLLAEISATLPRIYILSKADLVATHACKDWQTKLQQESNTLCLTNSIDYPVSKSELISKSKKLLAESLSNKNSIEIIVGGIPNVGKSTFINHLLGRKVANTGNEPAITKGQQRIKLDSDVYLIDTPGMLWPKLEDQTAAYKLAALGTIRNTAIDTEDVAWFAAEYLLANHPDSLQQRYEIEDANQTGEQLLELIAAHTGGISKGGRIDYHKAAETLLNDLRSGKLGNLCLESPE